MTKRGWLRMAAMLAAGAMAGVGMAAAQTAATPTVATDNAPAAFQVATVRPSGPDEPTMVQIQGNRFATTGTTIIDLMKYAYSIHPSQIVGGPDWMRELRFDLIADPETQTRPTSDVFKAMVQTLLTDRFHMALHREQRELAVFALMAAKGGPKLTKTARDPDGIPSVGYSPGTLSAGDASMSDLAAFLQRFVTDRPVVDQTGITGKYDMSLRWAPDETVSDSEASRSGAAANLPSLYTAIQEQLGLRLEASKQLAPALVIDHVEMPTEN